MNDLTLRYSGGSGGFFLLHLLLLSRQYHCAFDTDKSLDEIIEYQWNISSAGQWKSTEIWPNNHRTATGPGPRIYFYCLPDGVDAYPGREILLYTDLLSQLRLSFYKKAWMYVNKSQFSNYRTALKAWRTHYNNLKDPSWPKCVSPRAIKTLPSYIQKELLENVHTLPFLNTDNFLEITLQGIRTKFNDLYVHKDLLPLLNNPAMEPVLLQDIVNSQGQVLVDRGLLDTINNVQKDFINLWKNLHPSTLLEQIGID